MPRGRPHEYDEAPEEPDVNYGEFGSLAEKMKGSIPVPDDARLKELLDDGKHTEAREHALEMMEVARSLDDTKRAETYRRWLGE
ncbi:hypothetical protein J7K50_04095 [bacterium]|nr:hypothetical protein [bacterium]